MKRKLFFIINSIFLITVIGIGTQSCSDDDDKPAENGKKTVEITVKDSKGAPTLGDVTIWKNQDSVTTIQVNGAYSYDVSNEPSNTVFDFLARRSGFIPSGKKSVTLLYDKNTDTRSYPMDLVITQQTAAFVVDQSTDGSISFISDVDPTRNVSMFIPARATDLDYLEISPTFVETPVSQGMLALDAPNAAPSMVILDIESDWNESFNDGKMVTLTFPLTQGFVNAVTQFNLNIVFGTADNPSKTWESYPVTIDKNALTGTVQIPHFSTWYLTIDEPVTMELSDSLVTTLGTSACGESITVTYDQPNPTISQAYLDLLGLKPLTSVTETYTAAAIANALVTVQAHATQAHITIGGTEVDFIYYQPPVSFLVSDVPCDHSGGEGD